MALPAELAPLLADRRWSRDLVGEAGAEVFRLHAPGRPPLYLKYGVGRIALDVADEHRRLRWLSGRVAVPAVAGFVATAEAAWLVTAAIPGRTAYQCLADGAEPADTVVRAIMAFLRQMHALPVASCPFDSGHQRRMADAFRRLQAGEVDVDDFGEAHRGWTAQAVWDRLNGLLPIAIDRVVTHGDWSLDNILLDGSRVSGCIDVGRAGVADRYQDLAILHDCLGEFGTRLQDRMWQLYGIARPDPRKLAFHLALDEFF